MEKWIEKILKFTLAVSLAVWMYQHLKYGMIWALIGFILVILTKTFLQSFGLILSFFIGKYIASKYDLIWGVLAATLLIWLTTCSKFSKNLK
ncbi:MAG: hypothetical protein HYU63_07550 [Armatimonadetes bacterium]|nr:hypothetical protein [Armatimonadota bacterium]